MLSIRPRGTLRVLLHAVKSYDTGPSRFTSHQRGGFLSPLKIHRLGRGLNPQPLCPVASTLTTTPPWRPVLCFICFNFMNVHLMKTVQTVETGSVVQQET
jgi:hypothetical protein